MTGAGLWSLSIFACIGLPLAVAAQDLPEIRAAPVDTDLAALADPADATRCVGLGARGCIENDEGWKQDFRHCMLLGAAVQKLGWPSEGGVWSIGCSQEVDPDMADPGYSGPKRAEAFAGNAAGLEAVSGCGVRLGTRPLGWRQRRRTGALECLMRFTPIQAQPLVHRLIDDGN